jgi:hypothetical protein
MPWGVPKIGALATAASGDLTLIEPAGIAQGDLMVACIGYRDSAAFTLPSGGEWTLVATQQSSGDIDATFGIASGLMAWAVRGAGAPNLVFTRTAGDIAQGRLLCYTGATAAPFDVGTANTLASASATVTTATFTTAEANELIVAMTSAGDNLTATAFDAATDPTTASGATDTTTAPTAGTWIERTDDGTNTGADNGLATADAIRATAGATGTIQATISGSARHVMIAAAFKLSSAVTVAINNTNVLGTGTVGSVDNEAATVLSGNSGTTAVGDFGISQALTGISVTSAVGTDVPSASVPLTSTAGTGAAGTVTNDASVSVSGVDTTGAVGTVVQSYSISLTGPGITGEVGSVGVGAADITAALTGTATTGGVGTITASADVPSFTQLLSGVSALGRAGTVLAMGPVAVGQYRHSVPGPINGGSRGPQRLKTLERIFERMERKS